MSKNKPIGTLYDQSVQKILEQLLYSSELTLTSGSRQLSLSGLLKTNSTQTSNIDKDSQKNDSEEVNHEPKAVVTKSTIEGAAPIVTVESRGDKAQKPLAYTCNTCKEGFSTPLLFRNHSKSVIHGINVRRVLKTLDTISRQHLDWAGNDTKKISQLETEELAKLNEILSNNVSDDNKDVDDSVTIVSASNKKELMENMKKLKLIEQKLKLSKNKKKNSEIECGKSEENTADSDEEYQQENHVASPYYTLTATLTNDSNKPEKDKCLSLSFLRSIALGKDIRFPTNKSEGLHMLRTLAYYLEKKAIRSHESGICGTDPHKSAVLLCMGGRFSGCIFEKNKPVAHSSFQNYTVRRKQGGSQSTADRSGNFANSVGATIRRQQTVRFREQIHGFLYKNSHHLRECSAIYVFSPSSNAKNFYLTAEEKAKWIATGGTPLNSHLSVINTKNLAQYVPTAPHHPSENQSTLDTAYLYLLHRDDARIRNIPTTVRPPTYTECLRVYEYLSSIYSTDPTLNKDEKSLEIQEEEAISDQDSDNEEESNIFDPESKTIDATCVLVTVLFNPYVDVSQPQKQFLQKYTESIRELLSQKLKSTDTDLIHTSLSIQAYLNRVLAIVSAWRQRQETLECMHNNTMEENPLADSEDEITILSASLAIALALPANKSDINSLLKDNDNNSVNLANFWKSILLELVNNYYDAILKNDIQATIGQLEQYMIQLRTHAIQILNSWELPSIKRNHKNEDTFSHFYQDPVIISMYAAAKNPSTSTEWYPAVLTSFNYLGISFNTKWSKIGGRTALHLAAAKCLETQQEAVEDSDDDEDVSQHMTNRLGLAIQILFPLIENNSDISTVDDLNNTFISVLKPAPEIRLEIQKLAYVLPSYDWDKVGIEPLSEEVVRERQQRDEENKKKIKLAAQNKKKMQKQREAAQASKALEERKQQELVKAEQERKKDLEEQAKRELARISNNQVLQVSKLTEREKRLMALDNRLAVAKHGSSANVPKCGWEKCGIAILGVPFERCEYKYCTMDCLKAHKKKLGN